MKPIKLLLAVLPHTSWDDPQMEGQQQLQRLALYFFRAILVMMLFYALFQLPDGDWSHLIPMGIAGIGILTSLFVIHKRSPLAQRLGREALWLRAAVEGEDEQLAPLAADQPAPLSIEEQPSGTVTLGPLWHRKAAMKVSIIIEIVFGIIFIPLPLGIFLLIVIGMSPLNHYAFDTWFTVILAVIIACITLPLAYGGVQLLRLARHTALSAYMLADEQGIHWKPLATTKRNGICSIDWKQARSFFMIAAAESGTDRWLRGYALDAHSLLLTWQLSHRSSAQERAASDRLCRLIVTHTRLPLRDLSAAAEQISRQIERERQAEHNQRSDAAQQAG